MRIVPIGDPVRPNLSPDILFDGVFGDFAPAEPGEARNRGGLRAKQQLQTAVVIALMTDARAEPEELRDGDTNRGWPGDTFDLDAAAGEARIGSKLWLLRRSTVIAGVTDRLAETYALEALQPLIDQGAAAKATAEAVADPARNRLDLDVELTDRAGTVLVARRFRLLWDAV
jgi:phage gp46-like protein